MTEKLNPLDRIRREITRIAGNGEDAWDFVLELLATDWEEVMQNDKVACRNCQSVILYRETIFCTVFPSSSKNPFCYPCATMSLERQCRTCAHPFMTTRQEDYQFCGGRYCRGMHPGGVHSPLSSGSCMICGQVGGSDLCQSCMSKRGIDATWPRSEYVKVQTNVGRAVNLGLLGELTLSQWIDTLEKFDWLCAYCLASPYEHLDHFIPICKGGGTTLDNCVPACKECNQRKHQLHPDKITAIPQEALERVRTYLQQF